MNLIQRLCLDGQPHLLVSALLLTYLQQEFLILSSLHLPFGLSDIFQPVAQFPVQANLTRFYCSLFLLTGALLGFQLSELTRGTADLDRNPELVRQVLRFRNLLTSSHTLIKHQSVG